MSRAFRPSPAVRARPERRHNGEHVRNVAARSGAQLLTVGTGRGEIGGAGATQPLLGKTAWSRASFSCGRSVAEPSGHEDQGPGIEPCVLTRNLRRLLPTAPDEGNSKSTAREFCILHSQSFVSARTPKRSK